MSPFSMRPGALLVATLLACGGCASTQLYEGPKRDSDEVARISGDLPITAGSPVTVVLRQVDGKDLNVAQTSVEVLPGPHRLLADCRIAETKNVSRYSIDVEVAEGRHYRLRADAAPGLRSCSGVTLEAVD